MRVLVTGAAGFIGRWVVGELLERGHTVLPIDNLVAGDAANLDEFARSSRPPARSRSATSAMRPRAGAGRRVSTRSPTWPPRSRSRTRSTIPATTFENDVVGTFNLLEARQGSRAPGSCS